MTKHKKMQPSPRPPHPLLLTTAAPCAFPPSHSPASSLENSSATPPALARGRTPPPCPSGLSAPPPHALPAPPPPRGRRAGQVSDSPGTASETSSRAATTPSTTLNEGAHLAPAQFVPPPIPSPTLPRAWVTVAATKPRPCPTSALTSAHPKQAHPTPSTTLADFRSTSTPSPFVAPGPLHLPRVPAGSPVLTLAGARAALAAPSSVSSATLDEARCLVRTMGHPIRLDPRTGEPVAPPPRVTAHGIAPDHSAAFPSFEAAQNALRRGAQRAGVMLPPHVIMPGVARWTYVHFLNEATPTIARILAHLKLVYEDLALNHAPIPAEACAFDYFAAAGLACRLTREAQRLVNRRTHSAVPMPIRLAFAMTLRAHAQAVTQRLPSTRSDVLPFDPADTGRVPANTPPASSAKAPALASSAPSQTRAAPVPPPHVPSGVTSPPSPAICLTSPPRPSPHASSDTPMLPPSPRGARPPSATPCLFLANQASLPAPCFFLANQAPLPSPCLFLTK